jgi:hypothetical protein
VAIVLNCDLNICYCCMIIAAKRVKINFLIY